jgi:hypothetical protein
MNLFGGSSKGGGSTPSGGFQLTGGGAGAPWNWGVSPFDQSAIDTATGSNVTSTENRYNQLGLGGSTMEGQDVSEADKMGEAITGQEQTANVGNPALNPALQPIINQLITNPQGQQQNSQLSSLAGKALGAGIGDLTGGTASAAAGGISDATASDAVLGLALGA